MMMRLRGGRQIAHQSDEASVPAESNIGSAITVISTITFVRAFLLWTTRSGTHGPTDRDRLNNLMGEFAVEHGFVQPNPNEALRALKSFGVCVTRRRLQAYERGYRNDPVTMLKQPPQTILVVLPQKFPLVTSPAAPTETSNQLELFVWARAADRGQDG